MVMPTNVRITNESGVREVSAQPPPAWLETNSVGLYTIVYAVEIETRDYLTWEDDPVLAELWDNEQDAAYDDL